MNENILAEHSRLIDSLGGTGAVSRMFNITSGAVSQWRTGGIPESRLMYLRLLRPDLFNVQGGKHD